MGGQSSRADALSVVIGPCMGGKATPFGNIICGLMPGQRLFSNQLRFCYYFRAIDNKVFILKPSPSLVFC